MSSNLVSWLTWFFGQLFTFPLLFGLTFGGIVVGFVGIPILAHVFRHFL